MILEEIRSQFPVLRKYVFLTPSSCGPLLGSVKDEIFRLYTIATELSFNTPLGSLPLPERHAGAAATREHIARFLGADIEEIALNHSVSDGINTVAFGLSWRQGDEVIISDRDYSSNVLPWLVIKERYGIRIRKLQLVEDQEAIITQLRGLIGPRTRLISVNHVTSDQGFLLPVRDICSVARDAGVSVHLDGAQSAGRFPVNVKELGCDFYTICGFKYLFGPYGVGAVFVRQEMQDKVRVSWTGSGAQKRWDAKSEEVEFWDTARKYEFASGRPLDLYAAWRKSFEFLSQFDLADVRARGLAMQNALVSRLREIPRVRVKVVSKPELSAGQVNFAVDGIENPALRDTLLARWDIICERNWFEPTFIRVCPAIFTNEDDMDRLVAAVELMSGE